MRSCCSRRPPGYGQRMGFGQTNDQRGRFQDLIVKIYLSGMLIPLSAWHAVPGLKVGRHSWHLFEPSNGRRGGLSSVVGILGLNFKGETVKRRHIVWEILKFTHDGVTSMGLWALRGEGKGGESPDVRPVTVMMKMRLSWKH
jgi:hypothetical protein